MKQFIDFPGYPRIAYDAFVAGAYDDNTFAHRTDFRREIASTPEVKEIFCRELDLHGHRLPHIPENSQTQPNIFTTARQPRGSLFWSSLQHLSP